MEVKAIDDAGHELAIDDGIGGLFAEKVDGFAVAFEEGCDRRGSDEFRDGIRGIGLGQGR